MSTAYFDLQPELHCFLPRDKRDVTIALAFKGRQTLKHLIESLGVPHTDVGLVTVNGQARSLDSVPHNGDRIQVHPAAPSCPVEPRFLLDSHLGRLAAYLRMSGFDCLYNNTYHDDGIAVILAEDARILLTRDRRLLMRKVVQYGYCLRSLEPPEQLVEVMRRFDLADKIAPLPSLPALQSSTRTGQQRCAAGSLAAIDQTLFRRVPPLPGLRPGILEGVALRADAGIDPKNVSSCLTKNFLTRRKNGKIIYIHTLPAPGGAVAALDPLRHHQPTWQ